MTDTPTPAPSGGTESPNCQGWPGREAVDGVCCTCGYHGTEETPCPSRSDKTHCVHWWEGDGEVTPPASAPGSGEVTAWGCEVDELVERIDRMTVEAGPGLDLRPHHQRMLIKEIWRLTEAVERARAEGEAKGRREGAVENRAIAEKARASIERWSEAPMRVYGCPDCGGFHITSKVYRRRDGESETR